MDVAAVAAAQPALLLADLPPNLSFTQQVQFGTMMQSRFPTSRAASAPLFKMQMRSPERTVSSQRRVRRYVQANVMCRVNCGLGAVGRPHAGMEARRAL